ncbi:MAG TPA: hypothetical protein VJ576_04415 [Rhodocyclaceae bacterium]|nr:hypothetical protein [Rhodocyclaceae bacterium]
MAAITINDLPMNHELDRRAMSAIRGGGAPWVFGWIRPYVPGERSFASGGSFVEVNNFYADQIINQIQVVDINNSAAGSVISVALDQQSANSKLQPPR